MSYDNTAPRHNRYSHSIGKQWSQNFYNGDPNQRRLADTRINPKALENAPVPHVGDRQSFEIDSPRARAIFTQKQDGSWDVRGHGKGGGSNPPHLGGSGGARVPLQPKPKSPAGGAALTVGK